jgi:hypothetical protein
MGGVAMRGKNIKELDDYIKGTCCDPKKININRILGTLKNKKDAN